MRHKVTLLPGEGIGPEVSAAVRRILDASGVQIDWEELGARAENTDKGTTGAEVLNNAAIESVRRNRVALKGPMATAIAGGRAQRERGAAEESGVVCEFAAGEESAGSEIAVRQRGRGDRAGEHRGFVLGTGARSGARAWWRA